MAGAKGSALEWALALMQAPGERHALRQRPLPAGVDVLLSIASGVRTSALVEAEAETGLDEATLREAARFYAREVLFFPQADPYRVLGVPADADADAIRTHHRLLQQWLHPDRQQSEDDAVFAARINTAWNQLRTPALRAAYGAGLEAAAAAPVAAVPARETVGWIATPIEDAAPPVRWQRWSAIAFGVLSLVLVLLVVVEADRPPPSVVLASGDAASQAPAGEEGVVLSVPVLRQAVDAIQRSAMQLRRRPDRTEDASEARAPDAIPDGAVTVASPSVTAPASTPPLPIEKVDAPILGEAIIDALPVKPNPAAVQLLVLASDDPPKAQHQAGAAVVAAYVATPVTPRVEAPDPGRVRAARQVGEQLVDFVVGKRRAAPPIWNSPAVQAQALQARAAMQATGRVSAGVPDWRVGQDSADVRVRFPAQGAQAGQLRASLVWRAEQWLVTTVDVARIP